MRKSEFRMRNERSSWFMAEDEAGAGYAPNECRGKSRDYFYKYLTSSIYLSEPCRHWRKCTGEKAWRECPVRCRNKHDLGERFTPFAIIFSHMTRLGNQYTLTAQYYFSICSITA